MFLTFKNLGWPLKQGSVCTTAREETAQKVACLRVEKSASGMEISGGHRGFTAAQHHCFDTRPSCNPAIRPVLQAHLGTAALGMLSSLGKDQHSVDPGRGSFKSTL